MFKKRKPRLIVPEKHKDYYKDALSFVNNKEPISLLYLLDLVTCKFKNVVNYTNEITMCRRSIYNKCPKGQTHNRSCLCYKKIMLRDAISNLLFEKAPGVFVPYSSAPQAIRPHIKKQIDELVEIIRKAFIVYINANIPIREQTELEERNKAAKEEQAILDYWEQE